MESAVDAEPPALGEELPTLGEESRRANAEERKHLSLWRHRNLVFGVPAIFILLRGTEDRERLHERLTVAARRR